jgi:UDP-glucose 4-epimerase
LARGRRAGCIGSHVVRALTADGREVAVLDDLSTCHREFVPDGVPYIKASLLERPALDRPLAEHEVEDVIDVAVHKYASESVSHPFARLRA